jgi:signal transduction histidine kinase
MRYDHPMRGTVQQATPLVRSREQVHQGHEAARRVANRKVGFFAHLVVYGTTITFLVFVAGLTPGLIVALSWGIGLSVHGFFAIMVPGLRKRWMDAELETRVNSTLQGERTAIAGRQARSLEVLSASIAHEIRNPVTAARSLVAQIGEDPAAPENAEYAKVALAELDRVERSITHLLRYARDESPRLGSVELIELVDSAMETLREPIKKSGVIVTRAIDRDVTLQADAEQLRRVVMNLVVNALEALEGTADACIEIEGGESLAGTEVWLRVRDNGPGIPADQLDRVFEPFRTSKDKGTGLGLPIARKIVEAHGGTLDVHSVPGRTELEVTIPRALPSTATAKRLTS